MSYPSGLACFKEAEGSPPLVVAQCAQFNFVGAILMPILQFLLRYDLFFPYRSKSAASACIKRSTESALWPPSVPPSFHTSPPFQNLSPYQSIRMCIGNRADSSAHYINSQLGALYENAVRCTEKHGNGLKHERSEVEYSTCLYEFYGPGRHNRYKPSIFDLSFFAKFGRPRLEFVCNHEVILFLEILEGHYNLDHTKASPKHDLHEKIENHTVAFRIDFSTHSIKDFHCDAIGNGPHHTMDIHVLNMDSAKLVEEHSHLPCLDHHHQNHHYTRERKLSALTHYLQRHYLQLLKRAGLHVLHSLPDFDNLSSTTAHVDYSVISKRTLSTDVIFGIRVEDINTFLTGLWLEAAGWIDEHGLDWTGPSAHDHIHKHFLAETRTSWTESLEDVHLHMVFGPMQIQPLCKREVVLYINIQDLEVHLGAGFSEHYHHSIQDLKLAFIVGIDYIECDGGRITDLRLNIGSARHCDHLSFFSTFHDFELFTKIKRTLIRYVQEQYIKIIEESGHTCVYYKDTSIHYHGHGGEVFGGHDDDDDCFQEDCHCEDEASCGHVGIRWGVLHRHLITQTEVCGFDMISAVTQGSINAHFKSLWEAAAHRVHLLGDHHHTWESHTITLESCLADYSFTHANHGEEVFFSSSFKEPKVQLMCSEGSQKAIFYLCLDKGFMRILGQGKSLLPGSEAYSFSNWQLAFEVDLKLVDATSDDLAEAILKRFHSHSSFKQLILDLSTAKFNINLSTVPGFLEGSTDFRAIRRVREALIYYIQTCYLPVFQNAHHHILYTIPMRATEHHHGLTSLKFQIIPFDCGNGEIYQGLYGRHRAIYERNMIAFIGMFDGHEMLSRWLPRHNWVCGSGRDSTPTGTIVLSREMFLQAKILERLRQINRQTTLVPNFSGVEDGELHLELATWSEHRIKKNKKNAGAWTQVDLGHESLDFVWNNRDEWRYQHLDDCGEAHYIVKCETKNAVSIPTIRRDTAVISVKGKTTLGLELCGRENDWSSDMSYAWSAAIRLHSHSRGLEVNVTLNAPKLHNAGCEHTHGKSTHAKVLADFERVFPKVINTEDIATDLKRSLEGAWSGLLLHSRELIVSHPTFNRRGDLLLELGFRSTSVAGAPHLNGNGKIHVDTVSINGGSHEKEGYFRHLVHKASDMVQSVVTPPPTYTPPFPLLQKNSKASLATSAISRTTSSSSSVTEVHEKFEQRSLNVSSSSATEFEELEEEL